MDNTSLRYTNMQVLKCLPMADIKPEDGYSPLKNWIQTRKPNSGIPQKKEEIEQQKESPSIRSFFRRITRKKRDKDESSSNEVVT